MLESIEQNFLKRTCHDAGLAWDKVVSGWGKNAHLDVLLVVCTCSNVRLLLQGPLFVRQVRQCVQSGCSSCANPLRPNQYSPSSSGILSLASI